jgi:hypothetical protein
MEYLEKINNLIASRTGENNYLAIQFMMNILHYSFEQAYSKLEPANQDDKIVSLAIADIEVRYKVDLQRVIYNSSSYADIDRLVYYKGEPEPDSAKRLSADDDSVLSLGEFGTVEDLAEIRADLAELSVYVESLFKRMTEEAQEHL